MHEHTIEDQPPPIPNDDVAVWDLVIADMQARDRTGRERYGTPLQVENGRDHLVDAYQEILDLVVYLRAEIEQRTRQPKHDFQRIEGELPMLKRCVNCGWGWKVDANNEFPCPMVPFL